MKSILFKFSFWLFLISIALIIYSVLGFDDKNIYIKSSNPILYSDMFNDVMWDKEIDKPSTISYIVHVSMYTILGVITDFIIEKNTK